MRTCLSTESTRPFGYDKTRHYSMGQFQLAGCQLQCPGTSCQKHFQFIALVLFSCRQRRRRHRRRRPCVSLPLSSRSAPAPLG